MQNNYISVKRIGIFINNNIVSISSGVSKSPETDTFNNYPIILYVE